jgi:hypothetical protein
MPMAMAEEDTSLTGEEGDEEQAIIASMIILQKMIEQMDIKGSPQKTTRS